MDLRPTDIERMPGEHIALVFRRRPCRIPSNASSRGGRSHGSAADTVAAAMGAANFDAQSFGLGHSVWRHHPRGIRVTGRVGMGNASGVAETRQ